VKQLIWSALSRRHLAAIEAYIARDSPGNAQRFVARLSRAPKRLEVFPLGGRLVPEWEKTKLFEIPYGEYRIIYQVLEKEVEIVAVFHCKRDLSEIEIDL